MQGTQLQNFPPGAIENGFTGTVSWVCVHALVLDTREMGVLQTVHTETLCVFDVWVLYDIHRNALKCVSRSKTSVSFGLSEVYPLENPLVL